MKIISYTVLNNEADIIEAFVRYNMTYIDKMIILDNGCTDNTIDILKLLQKEGYDIEIINESKVGFEQFFLMNKYMRLICEKYKPDWVIPLDADEFLMCEKESVREYISKLRKDRAYKVTWRQFVMSDDDPDDSFVLRKMRNSVLHTVGKVFFPSDIVDHSNAVLSAGQHDLTGQDVLVEKLQDLEMAHYPHRSYQQIQAKSLCHSVRYSLYANRANGETVHRNFWANEFIKHLDEMDTKWVSDKIRERTLLHKIDINKATDDHGINLKLQGIADISMKYADLAMIDTLENLYHLSQEMALRAYTERISKTFFECITILVYGTGYEANKISGGLYPDRIYNIIGYINSDTTMEFTMFNRRIVISPKWIKFIKYDKIVISSDIYYAEMKKSLLENGCKEEDIVGKEYLMQLAMNSI